MNEWWQIREGCTTSTGISITIYTLNETYMHRGNLNVMLYTLESLCNNLLVSWIVKDIISSHTQLNYMVHVIFYASG